MDFTNYNLTTCTPPQVVSLNFPVNDVSKVSIIGKCDETYDRKCLLYSYSIDNVCWSCYMDYDSLLSNTVELNGDFYVKVKLSNIVSGVKYGDDPVYDYTTQLASGFNFNIYTNNSNLYNPYANLEGAIALQQQLADAVSAIIGVPIYYFKLSPNAGSKDITFKEYALMDVEAVKQIKLIIADGQMPSSKPEFSDWGIDFQTDWETEISKTEFATAFGNNAQPMEGDLIYIPMMKRMWMVNGAYEEKNGALMWVSTTFKTMLVKYQEKGSVDLGDTEQMVQSFVKNKYEDLFGEDDMNTVDSSEASLTTPLFAAGNLYPVYESDAIRKYVTCDQIDIQQNDIYYRGTMISDYKYTFLRNDVEGKVIYQKKYCGDEISISFLIFPTQAQFEHCIATIGHVKIMISQEIGGSEIWLNVDPEHRISLENNNTNFVIIRWSSKMNIVDMHSYIYTYDKRIPLYKLQKTHYYFDIDNPLSESTSKFNIELIIQDKSEIMLHNFFGSISNFKIFDLYNDSISELLQMYPTHQHLILNDTARKIVGRNGAQL